MAPSGTSADSIGMKPARPERGEGVQLQRPNRE
jgi:hypothetical protein